MGVIVFDVGVLGGCVAGVGMRLFVGRLCLHDQITTMLGPAGDRRGRVGGEQGGESDERAAGGVPGRGAVRVVHGVNILLAGILVEICEE
jgi:hypothetical protein